MSVIYHLALGPYAEFRPPPQRGSLCPPEDEDGEPWFSQRLACDFYPEYDSRPRRRYRYVPATGTADREMHWEGQPPTPELADLSAVDPKAELAWFASEYREELSALARYFGVAAELRWGLISW